MVLVLFKDTGGEGGADAKGVTSTLGTCHPLLGLRLDPIGTTPEVRETLRVVTGTWRGLNGGKARRRKVPQMSSVLLTMGIRRQHRDFAQRGNWRLRQGP